MSDIQPGDVLLTRHRKKWGWLVRLGAALVDQPNVWNHVVVAHHVDAAGTFWGIEGQPGVVSYVDLTPWLNNPWTISNSAQPKTRDQRDAICAVMEMMVTGKTGYDWTAIIIDAARVVAPLWRAKDEWGGKVPAHVVCSSAADYAYEQSGLKSPHADRYCTPAHWAEFLLTRGWER